MDKYSLDLIKYRIEKAADELELSEYCIRTGKYSKSLNCSYYAIFHSARAVLALDNKDFKKHSGVISYFIKSYINTGIFDNLLGEIIITAERARTKGDYSDFFFSTLEESTSQFERACFFFDAVKDYLDSKFDGQSNL